MNHIWTVLCQRSAIDFENNLVSIFNCVEELGIVMDKKNVSAPALVIPVELQLVSFWTVKDATRENKLEFKGELVDPSGKTIKEFTNDFTVAKDILRFRNRTNIQGFPVTVPGRYYFRMSQREEKKDDFVVVAELPLDVNISYKLLEDQKRK